jgi:HPr kinase/phosphorylase
MTNVPVLTAADVFDTQAAVLELAWLAGRSGGNRRLEPASARYPGMALVGYLNYIHPNRVQILGPNEMAWLDGLGPEARAERLEALCAHRSTSLVIVCDDLPIPDELAAIADQRGIAVLGSPLASPRLIHAMQYYLRLALAQRVTMHGVFLNVMGIGVLLTGASGVGKSEVALELLSRNHRLVADDAVEIFRIAPNQLQGRCPEALRDFLEVRGLGILNIRAMFGETAAANESRLDMIVRFEQMSPRQVNELDRLQAEKVTRNILDVEVPQVSLVVAPGRNLAVLVETAVRHHMLQMRGVNPLQEFMDRQAALIGLGAGRAAKPQEPE